MKISFCFHFLSTASPLYSTKIAITNTEKPLNVAQLIHCLLLLSGKRKLMDRNKNPCLSYLSATCVIWWSWQRIQLTFGLVKPSHIFTWCDIAISYNIREFLLFCINYVLVRFVLWKHKFNNNNLLFFIYASVIKYKSDFH